MERLEDISKRLDIINSIDWNMTPEEAVTLYLEWGNNWSHGKHLIRSKEDISYYFVVNTWTDPPMIYLIRRNSQEATEIAGIELPEPLRHGFLESVGHNRGVYALSEELMDWLKSNLEATSQVN